MEGDRLLVEVRPCFDYKLYDTLYQITDVSKTFNFNIYYLFAEMNKGLTDDCIQIWM